VENVLDFFFVAWLPFCVCRGDILFSMATGMSFAMGRFEGKTFFFQMSRREDFLGESRSFPFPRRDLKFEEMV